MKNQYIQLVPPDLSLAEQMADYFKRNRYFLEAFEPVRSEEFFSLKYQQALLKREISQYEEKNSILFSSGRATHKNHRCHWVNQLNSGKCL